MPIQRQALAGEVADRQAGKPVRIIYLKSRRIQATSGTAAEFYRATAFSAGVHTVVLAHDAPSSEKIFSIYRRFHQKYKPFAGAIGLPLSRVLSDRIHFEYDGDPESTFIQVHTAGNVNFGRSFRITNLHFSGDRDGFGLWSKRLEEGTYAMPSAADAAERRRGITTQELAALLSGIDLGDASSSARTSAATCRRSSASIRRRPSRPSRRPRATATTSISSGWACSWPRSLGPLGD
jgi:hypothetical protein